MIKRRPDASARPLTFRGVRSGAERPWIEGEDQGQVFMGAGWHSFGGSLRLMSPARRLDTFQRLA